MKKKREYQKFKWPVYSGLRKGLSYEERTAYEGTCNYIKRMQDGIRGVYVFYPNHKTDTAINVYQLLAPVAESCKALVDTLDKIKAEYELSYGIGKLLTSEEEVLPLLPEHRVTSGPNQTRYAVTWKLAFPIALFPALAEKAFFPEFDLRQETYWYENEDTKDTPVRREIRALHARVQPLNDAGFKCYFHIKRVTTKHVFAELHLSDGQR